MQAMNIFVVEDSASIRRLLTRRVNAMSGMRVIGEAGGQSQALALIRWTEPDVVLLDLSLDSGTGLGLLRELRLSGFQGRVAVLTCQDVDAYGGACIRAGADAFYDKASGLETLFDDLAEMAASWPPCEDDKPAQLRDGLMSLLNEPALHQRLAQASHSAAHGGVDLAVYVLRLSGLAELPGDVADALAQQVSQRLRGVGEEDDIVARSAADQFAVVQTGLDKAERAASHARQLSTLMAEPFSVSGRDYAMGMELGMALFPAESIAPRGLLTLAQASAFGAL